VLYTECSISAGAPLQTPLGELTALPLPQTDRYSLQERWLFLILCAFKVFLCVVVNVFSLVFNYVATVGSSLPVVNSEIWLHSLEDKFIPVERIPGQIDHKKPV